MLPLTITEMEKPHDLLPTAGDPGKLRMLFKGLRARRPGCRFQSESDYLKTRSTKSTKRYVSAQAVRKRASKSNFPSTLSVVFKSSMDFMSPTHPQWRRPICFTQCSSSNANLFQWKYFFRKYLQRHTQKQFSFDIWTLSSPVMLTRDTNYCAFQW